MNLYVQRLQRLARMGDLDAIYEVERLDLRSGVAPTQGWPDSEPKQVCSYHKNGYGSSYGCAGGGGCGDGNDYGDGCGNGYGFGRYYGNVYGDGEGDGEGIW